MTVYISNAFSLSMLTPPTTIKEARFGFERKVSKMPTPKKYTIKCPFCGLPVGATYVFRHIKRYHSEK